MDARTFIENFGALAETPSGVKKLRELILQLAVRGQLVEQDPDDEPASELLKKIEAEKVRLVKADKINKSEALPSVGEDEILYAVPNSWAWTRLREISRDCGQTVPKQKFTYIDVGSIDKERGIIGPDVQILNPADAPSRARKLVSPDAVIYSTVRPYLLNIAVVDKDITPSPIVSTAFFVIDLFCKVSSRFVYYYLRSHPFTEYVNHAMKGMAYPAVNDAKMSLGPIPLPPLAEQKRIVAKVDELMGLCDELEARQREREEARPKLRKACFAALTDDGGRAAISRVRAHMPSLCDTPDSVADLRQTILQLAVMGRLVRQDPSDEPASELLKKIAAEKARLVKEGKIKNDKPLPPVDSGEVPYDLPQGWEWVRLGKAIAPERPITYGVLVPGPDVSGGVPLVRVQDLSIDAFTMPTKSIADEVASQYERVRLSGGEPLVGVVGSIGRIGVAPKEWSGAVIARAVCRVCPSPTLYQPYFVRVLTASVIQDQFTESTRTLAQPTLNVGMIVNTLFPLPPLAEQHRIVAKVDSLMALCDKLEAKLKQSQADGEKLMASIVNSLVEAA